MKKSGTELENEKKEKESLEQAIQKRIEELSQELQEKMQLKEMCKRTMQEADTRITQITSAIHEMNNILKPQEEPVEQTEDSEE